MTTNPKLDRATVEACAKVADDEPELLGDMPAEFHNIPLEDAIRAGVCATKKNIAAAIRALVDDEGHAPSAPRNQFLGTTDLAEDDPFQNHTPSATAPGHTDLMVPPETITEEYLGQNPLPSAPSQGEIEALAEIIRRGCVGVHFERVPFSAAAQDAWKFVASRLAQAPQSDGPCGLANLRAILADQPFGNSVLLVTEISAILDNKGGFMPGEAIMWFREWRARPPALPELLAQATQSAGEEGK